MVWRSGQQGERRQPDHHPVNRGLTLQPEGGAHSPALACRKHIDIVKERMEQLVQGGVAQLHLRLDADQAEDAHTLGQASGVLEQCRLADPRLPPQHQRAAETAAHRTQ